MSSNLPRALLMPVLLLALAGCELLGGDAPEQLAARREAEGKAIGGACRHAGRAIEDCYALNKKADKPAIFAGWREMNDYMRENKMEAVLPQLTPAPAESAAKADEPPTDGAGRKAAKAKKQES